MATVKEILNNKNHQIFPVKSTDTVTLALQIMKEYGLNNKGNSCFLFFL
jgi:hypothetical protein